MNFFRLKNYFCNYSPLSPSFLLREPTVGRGKVGVGVKVLNF